MEGIMNDSSNYAEIPGWHDVIRNLIELLKSNDRKRELIRELDKKIINNDNEIEAFFNSTVDNLSKVLGVANSYFYINLGEYYRLAMPEPDTDVPKTIESDIIQDILKLNFNKIDITEFANSGNLSDDLIRLLSRMTSYETIKISLGANFYTLGIIFFTSDEPVVDSSLVHDKDTLKFISDVTRQIEIGITSKINAILNKFLWAVSEKLFEQSLKPGLSFNVLAQHISHFFKALPVIKLKEAPLVHVLLLEKENGLNFLTLRGNSVPQLDNERVSISRSVTGIFFEQDPPKFYLGNPQIDYPNRYKSYFADPPNAQCQSMLSVPVICNKETIGVIVMESLKENTFKLPHLLILQIIEERFSSLIFAFKERMARTWLQQRAIHAGFDEYLTLIADQTKHRTGNALLGLGSGLEILKTKYSKRAIKKITDHFIIIDKHYEWLSAKMQGFSVIKTRRLSELIEEVIGFIYTDEVKKNTTINCKITGDHLIKSSLFICEIFYNIIVNAFFWTEQKRHDNPNFKGIIDITLSDAPPPKEYQETELNKFCQIKFRDNGNGVLEKDLDSLFEPKWSQRLGGSGFGLFATKEYILGLGGRIEVESKRFEFFEISLLLRTVNN
jgi:signal transduction histidine kinase